MKRTIRIFAFLTLLLFPFLINFSFSQDCTDSDSDGYYYEEGCGTPRDCNDANQDINPGAEEICNGYDDDCDGSLDEGCDTSCDNPEKIGSNVRITYAPEPSASPSLVWISGEYAISWEDYRDGNAEIYFARLDWEGNKIGTDIRVTDAPLDSGSPSLTWTGSEYGIAWSDERNGTREIYFCRLDSSGNKIGLDIRITYDSALSGNPSLVWTGKEYGVSWTDGRMVSDEIFFTRLDASGNKLGTDIQVTDADNSHSRYPCLIWLGSNYAVAWEDWRYVSTEIFFANLDYLGNKITSDIRVTDAPLDSEHPSLTWTGSKYGIAWSDERNGTREIYFARLDWEGNKIGTDIRITYIANSGFPSLLWNGSEYGLTWMYDGNEIYFARLDASGNKIGSDIRVTYSEAPSMYPSLVWTGSEYAISWMDLIASEPDVNYEIYFARIGCFANHSPNADAGEDSQAECTSPDGTVVTLDGSLSTDPDSKPGTNDDIFLFEWFEDFGLPSEIFLGTGEILDVILTLGLHVITLRVTDSFGEMDTDEVIKTVVDTTPPEISINVDPDTLWPPNHRMVDVEASVMASDICGTVTVTLTSITSSEPDDAPGGKDGNTVNDIQDAEVGTADFNFKLRAERMATGDGRTYTVTYSATDESGNIASASSYVNVPHNKGGVVEPLNLTIEGGETTIISWESVNNALHYDVIRGDLMNLNAEDSNIDLGAVVCIESDSVDTTTEGNEDTEIPEIGQVFFYLLQYNDGFGDSSYGTESAGKARIVQQGYGDCQ